MEQILSVGIIDFYFRKLKENLSVDIVTARVYYSVLIASFCII